MNQVVALLALVALASTQQLTPMCRPYAFMKVMEGCLGKDFVQQQRMRMMTTVRDTCLSMPTVWGKDKEDKLPTYDYGEYEDGESYFNDTYDDMNITENPDMMPGMMGNMSGMMGDMNDGGMMGDMKDGGMMGDMMGGIMGMMGDMMGGMMESVSKESMLGGMMGGQDWEPTLSNISCIMKEMQWSDEDLNPKLYVLREMINNLSLNPFLTMSINKEIDMCFQKSLCTFDIESPFGLKLSGMMNFAKCVAYGMFKSCAMSEIYMNLPMGPMDAASMIAAMAGAGQEKDMEEMEKENTFRNILMTMFGPMTPFMQ